MVVKNMKKIYYIVITPFFPSETSFRGPFIYDQVKALQKCTDYDIVVFKPCSHASYNRGIRSSRFRDIPILYFPAKWTPSYIFNGFYNNHNSDEFIRSLESNHINIHDIAIIHCHTSSLGACGIKAKEINPNITVLLQHHDKDPFGILNGKLASWKFNARYRAKKNIDIFNKVDCHICISETVKANLLSFPAASPQETYKPYLQRMTLMKGLKPIKPKRVEVLYNGVDTEKFYKTEVNRESIFTIGCIGNFVSLKRQKDLLVALGNLYQRRKITDFRILFVGSGPMLKTCINLSHSYGIDQYCEFIQEMHHQQLKDFYNNLDLFVLPTEFEGFGCVCTEAAACGVPFIIPDNQGAAEYLPLTEKELWTYKAGDTEQLANLILRYYTTPTVQTYTFPLDITILIKKFIDNLTQDKSLAYNI